MCDESERRKEAVRLYHYQKWTKAKICRHLNCTRPWLERWLSRYNPDDVEGSLRDRSHTPHQPNSAWSAELRQQVLEMRRFRSQQAYSLIGAEAIHYELKALNSHQVPPVRTIHSWLVAEQLVQSEPKPSQPHLSKPIALAEVTTVNEVQQLDLKGPFYLSGSSHKYYLAVLRDRYSRRCALEGLEGRQAQPITDFLIASWQWLGRPHYLQMDNALEFRGSNRYPRSFGRIVRVALDLGIEPIFNPPGEPWRNGGVESHNRFLQERLLSQQFAGWAALRHATAECQTVCNQSHRLAALDGATPDEIAAKATLDLVSATYCRHQATTLPQNKGFVSFIRLVRKSGRITLGAGDRFMVDPALAYTYVLARVDLTRQLVVISQNGQALKTYDYSPETVGAWAADDHSTVVNEQNCNASSCTFVH